MAQSKSFFGLRKGSTKSLTFQVLNGKQITKDRVYNVKNPQTLAQMQQRALMATVVTAYSSMKTICDHSFEDVEVGAKTMGEFLKTNISELKKNVPEVNLTEYKGGNFANNFYIVSKGSLTSLEPSQGSNLYNYETGKEWDESLTYAKLAEAVGLKKDGMITVMLVSSGVLYWVRLKFTEKILASSKILAKDTVLVTDMQAIDADSVEGNAIELAEAIKVGVAENGTGKTSININTEEGEAVALIKSIKEEGKWKRSTERLRMEDTINFNYNTTLGTYPINTSLLLNGGNMPSNILK